MSATEPGHSPHRAHDPEEEVLRAAFRELHGRRLHGFALLYTLGDRQTAARLASDALSAGADQLDEHRHPERAAAWLRRRVVDGGRGSSNGRIDGPALVELGAGGPVIAALARLERHERAAIIASGIERLDRRDVATIVGRDGTGLDRLLRRARERYVRVHIATATATAADPATEPDDAPAGPIASHVLDIARRAMT
jgi:hypothetical protein